MRRANSLSKREIQLYADLDDRHQKILTLEELNRALRFYMALVTLTAAVLAVLLVMPLVLP